MENQDRSYGIVKWEGGGYQIVGRFGIEFLQDHPNIYHGTLIASGLTQEEAYAMSKLLPHDK